MFHSRSLDSKINKLHERALRIVFNDDVSSFGELLEKDNSAKIHTKNLRFMAIEMYKIKNKTSPHIMQGMFPN